MVVVFLFNLMCAIVSCDPFYTPPTSRPFLENGENSFLLGYRSARNFDLNNTIDSPFELPRPLVETQNGMVEGYMMNVTSGRQIYAFEGIPYAEMPQLFKPPVRKRPWSGIRQAKNPGHLCTQLHQIRLNRVIGHEDCLKVHVYTPMISFEHYKPNMSVVIFIHGGSFFFGAGSEYGPAYLLEKNIVLVTVNYRLGTLGFLSTGDEENPGNWGLKDQAMAIQWVADNIENFGGNPNSITLLGQSAGAVAVHLHMMSNLTKHLIHKAISMSGSAFVPWAVHTPHQARKWAEKLARFMRCPTDQGTKAMMNCFRRRDPNFLTANQYNLYDVVGFPPVLLRPVIEPDLPGAFLTLSPKDAYEQNQVAKIPYIASNTREEAEFIRLLLTGFGFIRLFLRNWEVLAPTMLDYRRVTPGNTSDVTHAIVDFYAAGQDIRKLSKEVSRVGTDRFFNTGNRKTLKYHSTMAPTYSYIFTFKNPKGFAHLFGMDPKQYGVSHSEDLGFVFNSSLYWEAFNTQEDMQAIEISKLVISMFTNFINTGEPLYTDENGKDTSIWEKVTDPENPRFLDIDKEVKMIDEPAKESLEFWENLHLDEAYPYEYA